MLFDVELNAVMIRWDNPDRITYHQLESRKNIPLNITIEKRGDVDVFVVRNYVFGIETFNVKLPTALYMMHEEFAIKIKSALTVQEPTAYRKFLDAFVECSPRPIIYFPVPVPDASSPSTSPSSPPSTSSNIHSSDLKLLLKIVEHMLEEITHAKRS